MRVLLDTSCLVAAALTQHEHHAATVAELGRRRAGDQAFVIAAHTVLETYAVLTRLPPPHRLAPDDALAVLERNWAQTETVALTGAESWRVLRRQAAAGVTGGRVYDAHIAACGHKAHVDEILTWNVRHFDAVSGVRSVAPGSSR